MRKQVKLNDGKAAAKTQQEEPNEKQDDFLVELKRDQLYLISSKNSVQAKLAKVNSLYKKIEGFIYKIANTKIGGRTLQLMLKLSDEGTRTQIFQRLLQSEHQFSELIKSNYGHYVAITMVRTMPNSFKNEFFKVLQKNLFQYLSHQQGSQVMDRFILKCVSPAQMNQLKASIKEQQSTEVLENTAIKIIDKALHERVLSLYVLNLAFPVLVPVEREKIVNHFVALESHEYLKFKEGAQLFCTLVNITDSKQRKTLMKTLSASVQRITEEDSYFYVAIMKLILSVDDTKMSHKLLLKQVHEIFRENLNKHAYSVISALFVEKHNELAQFESTATVENTNSKKEQSIRLQELCQYIIEPLTEDLTQMDTNQLLKSTNFSRFTGGVCKFIAKTDSSVDFLQHIINNLLEKSDGEWILAHPDSQRLAKALVLLSVEENAEQSTAILGQYVEDLTKLLLKNIKETLSTKAVYLLVALFEQTSNKDKITKQLKKLKPSDSDFLNASAKTLLMV